MTTARLILAGSRSIPRLLVAGLLLLAPGCKDGVGPEPIRHEIAYVSDLDLKLISADGAETFDVTGGSATLAYYSIWFDWSPDGEALAFTRQGAGGSSDIYRIGADGQGLHRLSSGQRFYQHPAWSPDGGSLAFQGYDAAVEANNWDIYRVEADGTGERNLTAAPGTDWAPRWSPDAARLVFEHDTGLALIGGDGAGHELLPLPAGCRPEGAEWSPDGDRIAFALICEDAEIYTLRLSDGTLTNLTRSPDTWDFGPTWSPDGTRIAYLRWTGLLVRQPADIFVMDDDGGGRLSLASHPAEDLDPAWSPDGTRIAFASSRDGNWEIYLVGADGGSPQRLTTSPTRDRVPRWRPSPP